MVYCCLCCVIFCVWMVLNILSYFILGVLLVILGDCFDVLVVVCLLVMNGIKFGVILLIGGFKFEDCIMKLCE